MVAGVRGRQRPAPPAPAGTPALRSQEARSLLQREKRLALLYTHTPSPKHRFPGLASDSWCSQEIRLGSPVTFWGGSRLRPQTSQATSNFLSMTAGPPEVRLCSERIEVCHHFPVRNDCNWSRTRQEQASFSLPHAQEALRTGAFLHHQPTPEVFTEKLVTLCLWARAEHRIKQTSQNLTKQANTTTRKTDQPLAWCFSSDTKGSWRTRLDTSPLTPSLLPESSWCWAQQFYLRHLWTAVSLLRLWLIALKTIHAVSFKNKRWNQ